MTVSGRRKKSMSAVQLRSLSPIRNLQRGSRSIASAISANHSGSLLRVAYALILLAVARRQGVSPVIAFQDSISSLSPAGAVCFPSPSCINLVSSNLILSPLILSNLISSGPGSVLILSLFCPGSVRVLSGFCLIWCRTIPGFLFSFCVRGPCFCGSSVVFSVVWKPHFLVVK